MGLNEDLAETVDIIDDSHAELEKRVRALEEKMAMFAQHIHDYRTPRGTFETSFPKPWQDPGE